MATVRESDSIGSLASYLAGAASRVVPEESKVVRKNVREGTKLTRGFARAAAGPHGLNYYKRISGELTGPLQGEFGPEGDVVGNAVGAGWRNGPPNTDLEKTQDVIGPQFADDALAALDRVFR